MKHPTRRRPLALALALAPLFSLPLVPSALGAGWQAGAGPLKTRWAKEI
jgi:hypothetical protein